MDPDVGDLSQNHVNLVSYHLSLIGSLFLHLVDQTKAFGFSVYPSKWCLLVQSDVVKYFLYHTNLALSGVKVIHFRRKVEM